MAISHVKPLLLLLASLFFLPALYAIKFEYCNKNTEYAFGKVTDVEVTKDDVTKEDGTTTATIYVSVTINEKLTFHGGSVIVEVTTGESVPEDGRMFYLSEVVDSWPVRAGSHVVLVLTKVPLQNYELVSYDKAIVTVHSEDLTEVLCINFNLNSSTASAAVSA